MRPSVVPKMGVVGDSLVQGFGASGALSGFRGTSLIAGMTAGAPFFMVGSPTFSTTVPYPPDPWSAGVPGTTVPETIPNVTAYRPDIFFLEGGTNNVTDGQDASTILDNWTTYLTLAAAYATWSWTKFIVVNILRRFDSVPLDNVGVAVNAGLAARIAASPIAASTTLIDWYSMLTSPSQYNVDGIHPNNTGYAILGNGLYPFMAPVIATIRTSSAIG